MVERKLQSSLPDDRGSSGGSGRGKAQVAGKALSVWTLGVGGPASPIVLHMQVKRC